MQSEIQARELDYRPARRFAGRERQYQTCIKDLIGPRGRELGVTCRCTTCRPPEPDYKMLAAGDSDEF